MQFKNGCTCFTLAVNGPLGFWWKTLLLYYVFPFSFPYPFLRQHGPFLLRARLHQASASTLRTHWDDTPEWGCNPFSSISIDFMRTESLMSSQSGRSVDQLTPYICVCFCISGACKIPVYFRTGRQQVRKLPLVDSDSILENVNAKVACERSFNYLFLEINEYNLPAASLSPFFSPIIRWISDICQFPACCCNFAWKNKTMVIWYDSKLYQKTMVIWYDSKLYQKTMVIWYDSQL